MCTKKPVLKTQVSEDFHNEVNSIIRERVLKCCTFTKNIAICMQEGQYIFYFYFILFLFI